MPEDAMITTPERPTMPTFDPEALKRLRAERKWTQAELAARMYRAGYRRTPFEQQVAKWENGLCAPKGGTLIVMARALGVAPEALYRGAPEALQVDGVEG